MNKTQKNILMISLIALVLLGPCFALVPNYLARHFPLEKAALLQMLSFLIALAIASGVSILLIRKQKIDLKEMGLFTPSPWYANLAGVLTGILWAVVSSFSLLGMDPQADIIGLWLNFSGLRIALMLIGPIGACLEDFFTRGFLMHQLKNVGASGFIQALFSALLFALYHSIWMVPLMGIYFIYGFISSLFYGILLAGLYFLGKRSLTPVMLSHGITVLLGEPLLTYVLLKSFMF